MIRIYRCIIAVLMIAAIGFGVWYCVYTYDEQNSIKDGTLVFGEVKEEIETKWKENAKKGVFENVSDYSIY